VGKVVFELAQQYYQLFAVAVEDSNQRISIRDHFFSQPFRLFQDLMGGLLLSNPTTDRAPVFPSSSCVALLQRLAACGRTATKGHGLLSGIRREEGLPG